MENIYTERGEDQRCELELKNRGYSVIQKRVPVWYTAHRGGVAGRKVEEYTLVVFTGTSRAVLHLGRDCRWCWIVLNEKAKRCRRKKRRRILIIRRKSAKVDA